MEALEEARLPPPHSGGEAATRAAQPGHPAASRASSPPGTERGPNTAGPPRAPAASGLGATRRGRPQSAAGRAGPPARDRNWARRPHGEGERPRFPPRPPCPRVCGILGSWDPGAFTGFPSFASTSQFAHRRDPNLVPNDWVPMRPRLRWARADAAGAREPAPRAAAPSRRPYGTAARAPAARTGLGDRGATGGSSGEAQPVPRRPPLRAPAGFAHLHFADAGGCCWAFHPPAESRRPGAGLRPVRLDREQRRKIPSQSISHEEGNAKLKANGVQSLLRRRVVLRVYAQLV